MILANVPEAATSGLLDRPADELERLVQQASSMGPAELTRAAEVFNAGLTEMRGATSPRLLLELMCARVLLPGAEQGEGALLARLERLERGGTVAQMAARAAAAPAVPAPSAAPVAHAPRGGRDGSCLLRPLCHAWRLRCARSRRCRCAGAGGRVRGLRWRVPAGRTETRRAPGRLPVMTGPRRFVRGAGAASAGTAPSSAAASAAPSGGTPPAAAPSAGGAGGLQSQWPAVLAALKQRSIVVWANVSTNAQVVGVEGNLVTLGFTQVGAMKNFTGGGKDAVVAAALGDVLGGTWRVEAVVGGLPDAAGVPWPRPSPPLRKGVLRARPAVRRTAIRVRPVVRRAVIRVRRAVRRTVLRVVTGPPAGTGRTSRARRGPPVRPGPRTPLRAAGRARPALRDVRPHTGPPTTAAGKTPTSLRPAHRRRPPRDHRRVLARRPPTTTRAPAPHPGLT
ncbi:hypothetical protein [Nonomuraea salmonea]|uniref:hypothetical protein n=1 Tax=Nonomuraea salmonea TaxID=46181 RepID=UPI002FE76671